MSTTAWIVVIYFVISAIGSWASRKQKKVRETARREGSGQAVPEGEQNPLGSMLSDPEPQPRPDRQTPDEIAAEIRRVMGFEREESRLEVIEEVHEEPLVSGPSHVFEPPVEQSHGGDLRERLEARESARRHGAGGLETRQVGVMGSGRVGSLAAELAEGGRPVSKDRGPRAYIDISNLARALVTMEVLGPPKALRDDF